MKDGFVSRDDIDWVLPGWTLIWSLTLSTTIFIILSGSTSDQLSDSANRFLGLALGGLFAAWMMLGTWSVMIDLPGVHGLEKTPNTQARNQQFQPRIAMTLVWMVTVAVLAFLVRRESELADSGVFGAALLSAALSILSPLIVWQWTYRRIHRGDVETRNRRSIRQILGLTAIMAVVIAVLQLCHQVLGVPFAFSVLVVISSILWIVMLSTMLGRRWWMVFASIPAVAAQVISISFLVDAQSTNIEGEIMRMGGFVGGFYLCGMLLLTLARSSSHRWVLFS